MGENMLQFYLLSVLVNALAGYILFFGDSGGVMDFRCGFSVKSETFRLVVGVVAAITGLFKFLSSIQGDLPIIGDIVPAAVGFMAGFILILENYSNSSAAADLDKEPESGKKDSGFLIANKKLIGAAAMITAVLHFLMPRVLLL
jgi:hypothetical protein